VAEAAAELALATTADVREVKAATALDVMELSAAPALEVMFATAVVAEATEPVAVAEELPLVVT